MGDVSVLRLAFGVARLVLAAAVTLGLVVFAVESLKLIALTVFYAVASVMVWREERRKPRGK